MGKDQRRVQGLGLRVQGVGAEAITNTTADGQNPSLPIIRNIP